VDATSAFVNYTISIAARTAVGLGPSVEVSIRTLPTAPDGPVRNLALVAMQKQTLTASFEAPDTTKQNGVLSHYIVHLFQNVDDPFAESTTPESPFKSNQVKAGASLTTTFSGLEDYVAYRVEVTPFNLNPVDEPGTEIATSDLVKTLESAPTAPVQDLALTRNTANELTWQWSEPRAQDRNGEITRYEISVTRAARAYLGGSYSRASFSATRTTQEYSLLQVGAILPACQYAITIRAGTSADFGTSLTLSFLSASARPTTPAFVQRVALPDTSDPKNTHALSWSAVSDEMGPIRRLKVVVEPFGSASFNQSIDCQASPCTFPTYDQAREAVSPTAYITAQFEYQADAPVTSTQQPRFIVGDDTQVGGFTNGPLNGGQSYTYRILACTKNGATELCQASARDSRVNTTNLLVGAVAVQPSSTSSSNPFSMVLIGGVLLLVLLLAILFFLAYHRFKKQSGVERVLKLEEATGVKLDTIHVDDKVTVESAYDLFRLSSNTGRETHAIKLNNLEAEVARCTANGNLILSQEFEQADQGQSVPRQYAQKTEHTIKDRYANILPCMLCVLHFFSLVLRWA
jgi:hypothetical protein